MDLGLMQVQYDFILTWLQLQRLYLQIKSHSEFLGWHEFGGVHHLNQYTSMGWH